MKTSIPPVLITFALVCFALLQNTQAVSPPPDGGYPGGNTAEGQNALLSLTSGTFNTAVGFASLKSNTVGNVNTAIGVNALSLNTTGVNNTANGVNALYSNTNGDQNTANGVYALFRNTTGRLNAASGAFALSANTTGSANTAVGQGALVYNTIGGGNTAIGQLAAVSNITGNNNTAVGQGAMFQTGGVNSNTAVGAGALYTAGGDFNTALGVNAGYVVSGSYNIFIGAGVVGPSPFQESNTIRIADNLPADPGASACFIGGINGQTTTSGTAVFINSSGKLGTITSSARFKKDIKPMDSASEVILSLRPVTFHYRSDTMNTPQFGLVAEEVARMDPALVLTDKEGKPYTVRYEAVNAMLLNEFLKEHRKNEEQQATIAQLKSGMEALIATVKEQAAQIQKVSAQLEANKLTPQVVANDQ
jgi:Chaperone of endosialidase